MKRKWKGIGVILFSVVLVAAGVTTFLMLRGGKAAKPQIKTAEVRRGTVMTSVTDTGVLQALTTVEVKSNVGGQVVTMNVEEGDYVEAGQLIAQIDQSDARMNLDQSQADLDAARAKANQSVTQLEIQKVQGAASVASAEKALSAAQIKYQQAVAQRDNQPALTEAAVAQAKEGLDAAQASLDQTMNALIPQKVASARSAYDQAKASYDQSKAEYARQQQLLKDEFVSQKAVEAAKQQFENAQAQLATAKQKFDTIDLETAADLKAAQSKVRQAETALHTAELNGIQDDLKRQDAKAAAAAVDQARAALSTAQANAMQSDVRKADITSANATVKRSQASMKNALTTLSYTTITAPRAGVVVKKYVEQGTVVSGSRTSTGGAGVTLVEIADISTMYVTVNIDETDIAKIKRGQDVDISVDAYPDELFGGKVSKIAPRTITEQNVTTIPVTVEVAGGDKRLKPGMNAKCDFVTEKHRDVLYVPNEAVKDGGNGSTVTVMNGNAQEVRTVRVGLQGTDKTEITDGLQEGDKVITQIIDPNKKPAGGAARNTNGRPGMGMPGGGMPRGR